MSGEMGGGAIEMALLFWFLVIAIGFFYALYNLLKWVFNRRKPQEDHKSLTTQESKDK